jgi:hypothetical protein
MTPRGKQGSEKTLLRRITLLDRLPVNRGPATGLTVGELTEYLNANGYKCGRRTVERDLKAFIDDEAAWRAIGVHLLCNQQGESAAVWSHTATSKAVLLKALTNDDALLLSLLEQELKYFLPASAYSVLSQYLQSSDRVLSLPGNQRQSDFRERIRVIPDASLLRPPGPNIEHLQEINEALLRQEQIEMEYWSSAEKIQKQYRLHPVGLVKQGLFFWLLAVKDEKALGHNPGASVQSFRVNRIVSVARRQQETVASGLPTLTAALDGGALHFFETGMIKLRLRFAAGAAGTELCNNYREAPLSQDQEISSSGNETSELKATVRYSRQLVWMLQGQANLLRVIEPVGLKDEITRFLSIAVAFQQ